MSFASVFVPTNFNLWAAGLLAGDLGFISAYRSVPRIKLLEMLGELYKSKHNVTSEDIAHVLKAPVELVDVMKPFYDDGTHDFDFYAQYIASLVPGLPHPMQGYGFVIVFSLLGFVTLLALAGRLYARYYIEGGIRCYDWVVIGAFLMTIGNGITMSIEILTFGKPRTEWDLTQNGDDAMQAIYFASFFLYTYAMLSVKLSILMFYYGLTSWRPLRWSVIGTMATIVLSTLTCTFLEVFKSKPVLNWTNRFFNYFVLNEAAILLSLGVFLILTDVLVWLLPLPLVWKLKNVKTVSRSDRWYAVLVFGVGMLVVAASVARILIMRTNLEAENGIFPGGSFAIVSTIEPLLAIICACFPALRALYNKYPTKFSALIVRNRSTSDATDDKHYLKVSLERIPSNDIV